MVDTVGPAVVAIKHRDGRGQVAMAALSPPPVGCRWLSGCVMCQN